jgi:decaprenylphospho-beta-D-erythro-pentofuranosid-2-ulose 2-reductase
MTQRRIIVLGALSAIAEASCRRLAEQGADFVLLARDATRLEAVAADLRARGASKVVARALDLATAADQAQAVLRDSAQALGGVDAVLVFYGLLGQQAQAETDLAAARAIIDVNFTSAALWSLAAAETLEAAPAGRRPVLLLISSVAGDRGRQSNYVYGAAKGGLSILAQGLAHRFAKTANGPRAVLMKLGFVDTPMTDGLPKGGPLWASPDKVANDIVKAMDRGGPIVYSPWFWRWILLAIRLTPAAVFHKTKL